MMSLFLVIIALNIFLSSVEGVGKLVVCKVANPTSFCQEKGGVRHQTNQHRPKTLERLQTLIETPSSFSFGRLRVVHPNKHIENHRLCSSVAPCYFIQPI